MPLPRITALSLSVSDPEALAAFYCDVLGMHRLDADGAVSVGYGENGARLDLVPAAKPGSYSPDRNDRYWKIAITLPDLDMAFAQLREKSVEATEPIQFRDIAYMSHLADPEGHVIELIQHTFQGKPLTRKGDAALPLGGGARLGLITLRTDDIDGDLRRCRDELLMRYLSRQDLPDLGFCLYFFAFTQETPPVADVSAVENREWLWQRSYTVLEFQHRLRGPIVQKSEGEQGAAAVVIGQRDSKTVVLK